MGFKGPQVQILSPRPSVSLGSGCLRENCPCNWQRHCGRVRQLPALEEPLDDAQFSPWIARSARHVEEFADGQGHHCIERGRHYVVDYGASAGCRGRGRCGKLISKPLRIDDPWIESASLDSWIVSERQSLSSFGRFGPSPVATKRQVGVIELFLFGAAGVCLCVWVVAGVLLLQHRLVGWPVWWGGNLGGIGVILLVAGAGRVVIRNRAKPKA